jgi:hypothetical protein
MAYDLETIVEYLKMRPTGQHITKIKEELIALKQFLDSGKNSLISNSQLNRESSLIADKVRTHNPLVYKHRLINAYVDSYKHKLCLKGD